MATVGRLSLKVAHEVRNPIAAIELNAEILQDIVRGQAGKDGEDAAALVTAIRDQVTALDALTEEYLAFARFPKPHFEEESINHLLQELAEFVRPLATRQGLTLRAELDPDVPLMEIDRTLMRQAILNLVKNGMEALSHGGALTLASRLHGEHVEIMVSDTGPGISPEVGERLFEHVLHHEAAGHRPRALDRASDHGGARRRADVVEHARAPARRSPFVSPSSEPRVSDARRSSSPTTIPACARASSAR